MSQTMEVLACDQFHEDDFIGKPYSEIPNEVKKTWVVARKIIVEVGQYPAFATCYLAPDKNGLCEIIAANWDSSD